MATTKKKAAKKKAKAKSKPKLARSAKSGKFVTKKFANRNKSTTVVES